MDQDSLLADLRQARAALLQHAAGQNETQVRMRPAANDWSVLEVLAHLVDVDRHWLAQALALRDEPEHEFVPFDDAQWKREHADLGALAPAGVLQALQDSHSAVLQTLAQLTPAELARSGHHPRGHAYTVADVFRRYCVHDRAHTGQLAAILAATTDR